MTLLRPAIHKISHEVHMIDLESADLREYEIDGNYGEDANNGAVDADSKLPVNLTIEQGVEKTRARMKKEVIEEALSKNPTAKKS